MTLPVRGAADLIILKDGTRVEAQKVWEDDGLVRFSLPNYDGIIITYSKEIVERIEKGHQGVESEPEAAGGKGRAISARVTDSVPENKNKLTIPPAEKNAPTVSGDGASPDTKSSVASDLAAEIDMSLVESVAGIQFYNARRAFKYQTGPESRFHTFKEAVDDLAAKFDKDPYWIGQNLGNTNDLGQIYVNLHQTEEKTETKSDTAANTAGIFFYDPRRPYKYWVTADSKHHTLEEAVNELAKQYARSPEWVIDHLGETNDLTEIHHNLEEGLSAEAGQ